MVALQGLTISHHGPSVCILRSREVHLSQAEAAAIFVLPTENATTSRARWDHWMELNPDSTLRWLRWLCNVLVLGTGPFANPQIAAPSQKENTCASCNFGLAHFIPSQHFNHSLRGTKSSHPLHLNGLMPSTKKPSTKGSAAREGSCHLTCSDCSEPSTWWIISRLYPQL